jgi:phosphoglucosamine mutase
VPQLLQSVRFKRGKPLDDKSVRALIADAEIRLGETGRLIIRESGTEPVIRVMGEGDDAALVSQVVNEIVAAIGKVA